MKVIFFGTAEFGAETLNLLSANHEVLKVFTGEPKKMGRGQALSKNPIHIKAEELGLNILNRQKPVAEDITEDFDVGVVVAYGALISKQILEKAKLGFLNLHPSDLPKFRGAAPIERTLEAGEIRTRICVIKMTPKLDDGDIVKAQNYEIKPFQNAIDLHKEFSKIGAGLMMEAIDLLPLKKDFEKQNESFATYAKKITKEELHLEASKFTVQQIINKVRAFAGYGYPFIIFEGKRVKIKEVIFSANRQSPLDIPCLDGFATPIMLKPEGKNFMALKDFIHG